MSKKLAIKGHATRGKEVIKLLEMMGGGGYYPDEMYGLCENRCYLIKDNGWLGWDYIGPEEIDKYKIFTLEEFLEKYPFKVGDKVFLYDNITEGCVTGMKWDEDKGTVKYCVYTSAECWCDVKELLKWNKVPTNVVKKNNENKMKNVLVELLEHIKNASKEELEKEFNELEEWSHVGPTVEEFMDFCDKVNKKLKYPNDYKSCCDTLYANSNHNECYEAALRGYPIQSFARLFICRDAYWKIAGEQMGLDKPWEPDWCDVKQLKFGIHTVENQIKCITLHVLKNLILVFPTEEMRDAFYENFKDLIEQCKELL